MPRSAEKKAAKAAAAAPSPTTDEKKPEWLNFSEAVAKEGGGTAFGEWQKAKELADQKRLAFEEAFIKEMKARGNLSEDKSLAFSYRYGMAFQVIDAKERRSGGGRKTKEFSFS